MLSDTKILIPATHLEAQDPFPLESGNVDVFILTSQGGASRDKWLIWGIVTSTAYYNNAPTGSLLIKMVTTAVTTYKKTDATTWTQVVA